MSTQKKKIQVQSTWTTWLMGHFHLIVLFPARPTTCTQSSSAPQRQHRQHSWKKREQKPGSLLFHFFMQIVKNASNKEKLHKMWVTIIKRFLPMSKSQISKFAFCKNENMGSTENFHPKILIPGRKISFSTMPDSSWHHFLLWGYGDHHKHVGTNTQ